MGTEAEFLDLLHRWLNGGRSPLVILKGYSELFLRGEFGTLTSEQQEVMQQIFHLNDEVLNSWIEFADFFRLGSSDKQPVSSTEIGSSEFALLQVKIFSPALTALQKIKDHIDELLQEKRGAITKEQRGLLDILYQRCGFAIQRWHEPLDYFKR